MRKEANEPERKKQKERPRALRDLVQSDEQGNVVQLQSLHASFGAHLMQNISLIALKSCDEKTLDWLDSVKAQSELFMDYQEGIT